MSSPILVWGAGAIGGTIAAALARAGEKVVIVDAAADHVAAINARGLRIDGPIFSDTVKFPAFSPEAVEGRFDRVILAVKAHHTEAAVQALAPRVASDGYVVSAQNGLNERVIAARLGERRTIGCFINFDADYMAPGEVAYCGRGAVVVGELDGRRSERIAALHRLMQGFEPDAELTDNIWGYLWGKLVYGTLLYATALTDDGIADVLDNRRYRPILARLAREIGAVAETGGIHTEGFDGFEPQAFAPDAPAALTEKSFDDMVAHSRPSLQVHSGIWRDLAVRKRRTEVDAQIGPVVTVGKALGVATPLTTKIIAMIHEIEEGRRQRALGNLDDLAATGEQR